MTTNGDDDERDLTPILPPRDRLADALRHMGAGRIRSGRHCELLADAVAAGTDHRLWDELEEFLDDDHRSALGAIRALRTVRDIEDSRKGHT